MSATGRGAARSESDYYPTPAWVTLRLLDHVELPGWDWLEPAAGEGHIIRAVNSAIPKASWGAIELREACGAPLRSMGLHPSFGDFLAMKPPTLRHRYDLALTNPPFSLAQEFVEHGLKWASEVIYLLRLSFLESQKRQSFFKRVGVPDVFVLPERPSFTGEGTDSCAYAWMRWRRGGQEGRISILYDKRQAALFPEVT